MTTFSPRIDILPPAQQRLWHSLRPAAGLGFALYGGTAIALRLGHRESVDFDFFSDQPLNREAIREAFPFIARSTVLQDQQNTLTVSTPMDESGDDHVKVSFFGTINFGRVGHPDVTDDGMLHVASLDDLMATKVKVILQRAEAKDYRDIAAMVGAGVNLSKGLAAARALYGVNFQPSESLKAMVYFDDGDLRTLAPGERTQLIQAARSVGDLPHIDVLAYTLTATSSR
jgi:Nucleotidyl transferase AbiEii toxin, Type IV TA system